MSNRIITTIKEMEILQQYKMNLIRYPALRLYRYNRLEFSKRYLIAATSTELLIVNREKKVIDLAITSDMLNNALIHQSKNFTFYKNKLLKSNTINILKEKLMSLKV